MPNTNTQTIQTFSIENKTFYESVLAKRLKKVFRLYNIAKKTTLPKKKGSTISWRKFLSLSIPTKPLVEGVTPDPNNLKIAEFKSTVKQYGDYIELSDLIDLIGIDPIVTETMELFAEQIGEVVEKLINDELLKSKNYFFAGDKNALSELTTSSVITLNDINKVKATLTRLGAQPFKNGKFLWFISPEVEYDLKNLSGNAFVDVFKYSDKQKVIDGEIGEFMGFKWIVDNNVKIDTVGASNANVHHCLVIGKFRGESPFGVVELEGSNARPRIIHKPLGSAGTDDPLNQRQTLGWKINGFGTRIMYDEALMIYACGSTLTPAEEFDVEDRYGFESVQDGSLATTEE